jgi:hypothetical protein
MFYLGMKRVFIPAFDQPQVNGLRLLAANPHFDIEFYDESFEGLLAELYDEVEHQCIAQKIRFALGMPVSNADGPGGRTLTHSWRLCVQLLN